jgi:hypothetical protein
METDNSKAKHAAHMRMGPKPRTHCKAGHELKDNVITWGRVRVCKTCYQLKHPGTGLDFDGFASAREAFIAKREVILRHVTPLKRFDRFTVQFVRKGELP